MPNCKSQLITNTFQILWLMMHDRMRCFFFRIDKSPIHFMSSPLYRNKKYHPTKEEFNENLNLFDVRLNQVFSPWHSSFKSHWMCVCSCEHWTFCNFQMKHGIIGLYPKCVFLLCFWKTKNKTKNNNISLNERPWHQHVYHKTFRIMVVGYTALGIGYGCKLLTVRAHSLYLMIRFSI